MEIKELWNYKVNTDNWISYLVSIVLGILLGLSLCKLL